MEMKEPMLFNVDVMNTGDIKRNIKSIIAHHIISRIGVVLELDENNIRLSDDIYDAIHNELIIVLTSLNLS